MLAREANCTLVDPVPKCVTCSLSSYAHSSAKPRLTVENVRTSPRAARSIY
jgi:hypothetical protein